MYVPTEARHVFVDGPVAIFVHDASSEEVKAALARLNLLTAVLIQQIQQEELDAPSRT
jgi:hypothetical protein